MARKIRNYPPEVLWIKKNQDFISIRAIEQHLGIPANCLNSFCRGFWGINDQYWPKIVAWVRDFTKITDQVAGVPTVGVSGGYVEPITAQLRETPQKEKGAKTASNDFLESRRASKGLGIKLK